jgi:hypothetical protein
MFCCNPMAVYLMQTDPIFRNRGVCLSETQLFLEERVGCQAANEAVPRRSTMILHGVYVLIALALGEYGAIDRSADPKWKLQFAVF